MSPAESPAAISGAKLDMTCGATPKRRRSAQRLPSVMNSSCRSNSSFLLERPGGAGIDGRHSGPRAHLVDERVRVTALAERFGQHQQDIRIAEHGEVVVRVGLREGDAFPIS